MTSDRLWTEDPLDLARVEAEAVEALRRARRRRELERQRRHDRRVEVLVAILAGVLIAAAIYFGAAPVAGAAETPVNATTELMYAAEYAGETKPGVYVVHDEEAIAAESARIGRTIVAMTWLNGTKIVVGDLWASSPAEERCSTIAHEYLHDLGIGHEETPRDPARIMTSWSVTPQCAQLLAPAPPAEAIAVHLAATATSDALRDELATAKYTARGDRHECMTRAARKATRRARERGRTGCRRAYAAAIADAEHAFTR